MRKFLVRTAFCAAALGVAAGCHRQGPEGSPPPAGASGVFTKRVSFAILEDYDKGHDLALVAEDFARFRELGVRTWRGSLGWDDYEPSPERYDFEWLSKFVSLADSMGITLRPYLGYTPGWAARGAGDGHLWNDPPRRPDQWRRFVSALAGRFRSARSIVSYEIYNEENVPLWWDGTAAEYAAILRLGADAIRAVDPDARVLLGGMAWPDPKWLDAVCEKQAAPFDVIPFHAYPETWTPDSIKVENYLSSGYQQSFLPLADRECGPKPIWINELGFPTMPGKSELRQAEWWVRAFATFLAAPRVEHLGIYEIRDQQQGTAVVGDAPNYYLGLLRADGTPKPAFKTVQLLVRLFGGDSITVADPALGVRVTDGKAGRLYHHLFIRPDGAQLAIVWDRTSDPMVELSLARPAGRVTAYTATGEAGEWPVNGRVLRDIQLDSGRPRIFLAEPVR